MPGAHLRIWPSGLVGRVILVLLTAVVLEYIGGAAMLEWEVIGSARNSRMERLAWQVGSAVGALERLPPDQRPALLGALSDDALSLEWRQAPALTQEMPGSWARFNVLAACLDLLQQEKTLEGHAISLRPTGDNGLDLFGEVALAQGALAFAAPGLLAGLPPGVEDLLSSAILAAAVGLAAVMVVRELAAPLRSLARVADLIGGPGMVLVQEAGPGEVRRVARTLNAMQARIHKLIEDRTLALAAVSHDLRTPIARLRLQADFVADQESRGAMIESLDDMEHMVASVLTYLAGETDTELPRPVDLALLLMTQTDAAADAGEHVRYEGEEHARAFVRAIHMKRAFANLIGNAVKYGGGGVVVRLQASPTSFIVQVDDNGPGIPPASLERALEPFCRLEPSRGQNSGSVGLGLSIVQQAVQREGGTFALSNRAEGGLRAEIVLPRTQ